MPCRPYVQMLSEPSPRFLRGLAHGRNDVAKDGCLPSEEIVASVLHTESEIEFLCKLDTLANMLSVLRSHNIVGVIAKLTRAC